MATPEDREPIEPSDETRDAQPVFAATGEPVDESPGTAPPSPPDAQTPAAPPAAAPRRVSRSRRVLLVVLFLLTCVGILGATVVTWVHQVALNTDRWVAVVGPVATNPAVIAATSEKISIEVVDTLQVQARLENRLPAPLDFVAVPITQAIQEQLQQRMAAAMATPEFEQAWLAANRIAHQAIVKILRGQSETIVVSGGYVRLDVWPLIGIALTELQKAGVIPADVGLPDLSQGLPEGAGSRLEQTLGITLPPDFGTIPLVRADRLETAQQAVRIFDFITVALILVTLLLALVTIWYSPRRLRMVVYLALGGIVAILLARFAIQALQGTIVSSITDADTATTIDGVLRAALNDLYSFSRTIILVGVVVAVVAYVAGRPAWLVSVAATAGGATRQAGAGAGALAGSAAGQAPSSEATVGWARSHRRELRLVGIAVIVFVIAWAALGIEIALLAAGLVGLLEIGLGVLGDDDDDSA